MKGFADAILMDLSMASSLQSLTLTVPIFRIGNSKLRSMGHSVNGRNQLKGYGNALFWRRSYLMYL